MLRSLGEQEYAEDASSCFLVSGECVFEVEAIEKAGERGPGNRGRRITVG